VTTKEIHTDFPITIPGEQLLNAVPELWFLTDEEGMILECNTAAELSIGRTRSELHGTNIRSLIVDSSHFLFEKIFVLACENKTAGEIEMSLRTVSGAELKVVTYLTLLRSQNGQSSGISVFFRDITERRRTELQLLRFANAIHYTINPTQITDPDGKIIYVNPAFEHASGYRREELIGKYPNILSSGKHDGFFWRKMWEEITSGNVWRGEIINKRKNGELFYTELLISPIIDPAGSLVGFIGTHLDITEKKRLEQQLIQSQKLESIGTLAAGIAHEVGNPLTSISSLVQVIQRTTSDANTNEKLDLVKNQINRIAKIIRELVDFSRPSNYETRPVNVNVVLQEAVNIVRYGKKAKDIQFITDFGPGIPSLLLVQDQIIQVFINILLNAVDAITREPKEIRVRTSLQKNHVMIEFEDTGHGIAPQHLNKIFEPFFTTKNIGEGTGLGLWISYGIIKNFHGEIAVESIEGRRTLFTVTLPIHS
jgi:PAS domain S-box-containing protein